MQSMVTTAAQRSKNIEDGHASKDDQFGLYVPSKITDSDTISSWVRSVTGAFHEHYADAVHNSASTSERIDRFTFLDELSEEVSRIAFHPGDAVEGEFCAFCEKLAQILGHRLFNLIMEESTAKILSEDGKALKIPLDWEMNALIRIVNHLYWE